MKAILQITLIASVILFQGCSTKLAMQHNKQKHEWQMATQERNQDLLMEMQKNQHEERLANIENNKELKESFGYSLLEDEKGNLLIQKQDSDTGYIVNFEDLKLIPSK